MFVIRCVISNLFVCLDICNMRRQSTFREDPGEIVARVREWIEVCYTDNDKDKFVYMLLLLFTDGDWQRAGRRHKGGSTERNHPLRVSYS